MSIMSRTSFGIRIVVTSLSAFRGENFSICIPPLLRNCILFDKIKLYSDYETKNEYKREGLILKNRKSMGLSKKHLILFAVAFVVVLIATGILIAKRQATFSGVWKVKKYRIVQTGEIISKEEIASYFPEYNYQAFNDEAIVLHPDGNIEIIDYDNESLSKYGTYKVKNSTLFFYYLGQDSPSLELDIVGKTIELDLYRNYGMDVVIIFEQTN